jgi:hypothetical protein
VNRDSREMHGVLDMQEDLEDKTVLPADSRSHHNTPASMGSHSVPNACGTADCVSLMML